MASVTTATTAQNTVTASSAPVAARHEVKPTNNAPRSFFYIWWVKLMDRTGVMALPMI
jgi:hypothetical protein